MPGVKLQTAVADNVVGLEYQGVFNVGVIDKLPDGRKKRFHVLVNSVTDAGRVDTDIGHVILFGQFFDGVSLGAEVHPAPLVTLKNADPNFATTMLNALAGKQPLDNTLTNLSGKDVAGLLTYLGLGEAAKRGVGTGENQIPDMASFSGVRDYYGKQLLPGGLILQWLMIPSSAAAKAVKLNNGNYQLSGYKWPQSFGVLFAVFATKVSGLTIQRDDTGEVQAVELVVRGRHKEVDSGEWKTGESNTTKVTSTNSYAKLTINGEVLYEVDLINMVEIVDGVDLMEAHRNALGL